MTANTLQQPATDLMNAAAARAEEFLTALFTPYDQGYMDLRLIAPVPADGEEGLPRRTPKFFPIDRARDAALFATRHASSYNLYVGVLPRPFVPAQGQSGKDQDIATAAFLWVDIDAGDGGRDEMAQFLEHVRARLPMPALVNSSGTGGRHVYWQLDRVYELRGADDRKRLSAIMRRIVVAIGEGPAGIHADMSCHNPSRILRIPGTFNHKTSPSSAVRGRAVAKPDRLSLDEWEDLLPFEPLPVPKRAAYSSRQTYSTSGAPPALVAWAMQGYPQGKRHQDIAGAAAYLRRDTDLPESVAYDLFLMKVRASPGQRQITDEEIDKVWAWAAP